MKHAESNEFRLSFSRPQRRRPVASEAEFYYRTIAKELERDTTRGTQKGHVFIFESDDDWREFQGVGGSSRGRVASIRRASFSCRAIRRRSSRETRSPMSSPISSSIAFSAGCSALAE